MNEQKNRTKAEQRNNNSYPMCEDLLFDATEGGACRFFIEIGA